MAAAQPHQRILASEFNKVVGDESPPCYSALTSLGTRVSIVQGRRQLWRQFFDWPFQGYSQFLVSGIIGYRPVGLLIREDQS